MASSPHRPPEHPDAAELRAAAEYVAVQAQEDLDRFFRLSLDLLCIAGFDGYFKRVNPAWQRVLGYTAHELLTRPYMDLVHPDDRETTITAARKLTEGHDVVYFENRYLHKDGTHRWLMWMAVAHPEQQVVYATARDVTERKAADETLRQLVGELELARRRAEEATEAKGAFVANMSHEIRTPLNAILGMTTLVLQTRLSAEQREYLATVQAAGNSLLAIVNDILDFSKIEARRLDLEHTEFELREIVGDAARMLSPRAGEKDIELACHIAPRVPEWVIGDPARLRQVVLNVAGNAVKFTAHGEVVIDVSVESMTAEEVTLQFSVRDTGVGIPRDKQLQIFQAFMQVDNSTTRRYGGTGLGLAIALRLVELMHGRLWVDSDPGRGSTFHFTARFRLPAAHATRRRAPRPEALDGLRVLVVDDNMTNRVILEEMLASWHMAPASVSSAADALETLRDAAAAAAPFDVVVSDCQMPDIDGFALARRVKQDRRLAGTKFVMLTSMARADDAARCRKLGISTCLTKPVKHSDLLDALATVFDVSTKRRRPAPLLKPADTAPRRLRVLVAEDNAVNRKLVVTLLHKRGHEVTAVANGREAVEAVARDSGFDAVLMDLQMPEMGGFEATRAIRDAEQPGGRRLPIVALTAHAMHGDRERCLEAGMDGYLAKPIDVNELIATVERFGGPGVPSQPRETGKTTVTAEPPAFDEQAALAHTGHDRPLLKDLIALFKKDRDAALARIERAIHARDAEAVRQAVHAINGPLGTLGAARARQAGLALEALARSHKLTGAQRLFTQLKDGVAALDAALSSAGLMKKRKGTSTRRRRGHS